MNWESEYLGFNQLAGLPDRFGVGSSVTGEMANVTSLRNHGGEYGSANADLGQPNKEAYYLAHCLPSISQILQRLHTIREEYESSRVRSNPDETTVSPRHRLNKLFILTNSWPQFVKKLKEQVLEDGWDVVIATSDLEEGLTKREKGIGVAIDMALAERAEVFVGNGFSSLSANIVMLRTANGFQAYTNRLL